MVLPLLLSHRQPMMSARVSVPSFRQSFDRGAWCSFHMALGADVQ